MSYLHEEDALCTHCQFPNKVEMWSSINVNTDPELKDLLLGGEINMAECESCHKIFYAEHFLLYHDPAFELMAFVYPFDHSGDASIWIEKTNIDFDTTQGTATPEQKLSYEPVTLFGLDALVQLVEEEEEKEIQGQIVSHYASDNGFKVHNLTHAQSRLKKLPRIIPYVGSDVNQASVLKALEKIKTINDRLFVYGKLEESLRGNAAWSFSA